MKKFIATVLACICVLGMLGCSKQPPQGQKNALLPEGKVVGIDVSSIPAGDSYSFNTEQAKEIMDYLSHLNLESTFEEDPNSYVGMTWVLALEYENGEILTVYHFGNMFIRTQNGAWYKMAYEEAEQFDTLLDELND